MRVLTIASVSNQKGLDTLLQAAAIVRNQITQIVFLVIGGLYRRNKRTIRKLHSLRRRLGLRSVVRFAGPLPNAASYIELFHAFALSSVFEGLPTVLVEAGMAGVPVATTDCQGSVDVVRIDAGHALARVGDPNGLAKAMMHVLRPNNRKRALSMRLWYRQEYSPERYASRIERVYRKCLRRQRVDILTTQLK